MEDFKMKIEIEDPIKVEHLEADHDATDIYNQLEYQALVQKLEINVKSEDLELMECIGSNVNLDIPKSRAVLEEFKKSADAEDPEFLDYEQELSEFHVQHWKLETDELIIKQESEETDNYLQSCGTPKPRRPARCHKCPHCSYEAKQKSDLKKHMVRHMQAKEVEMLSCQSCSFQSKFKSVLSRHVMRKHTEDTAKHKCDRCSYQSKGEDTLKRHTLRYHGVTPAIVLMDESETKTFSCESCSFRTRHNSSLHKHIMTKHTEDAAKHKCHHCNFQTRHKYNLEYHILRCHASGVKMKCDQCDYQTMIRSHLRRHEIVHIDESEVKMFSCGSCSFQTRHKSSIDKHMKSKHPLDRTNYKCH